jgi:hypothetical protein
MGDHIAGEMIRLIREERNPAPPRRSKRFQSQKDEIVLDEESGDPTDISQGYVVVRKRDLD